MRYPPLRFVGRILYSRTALEAEKAAAKLLQILQAKKKQRGQVAIGFDIEWRPTFRKGASPHKAAVMQLCADSFHCHVMHIIHSGIPPSLQLLLEDSTFLKVGVGICGDASKVYRDYNVCIKGMDDLSDLANKKIGGDKWGLASLSEALVCKELQKPKKIRLGNWEVKVLSKEQLQYAATDAFASWHVYEVLNNLPDIIQGVMDKKNEELESIAV
ncbi:Werner Syndrome-like exonuclease [Carica papaya]|uniref:Werner Syndrome-like exonuclease n=1 Tax=Carica papaya TaxID=3649 RepID=UPI000B8C7BAD|nr:Werner Syndrome-like exonuclease [Carica papaya]